MAMWHRHRWCGEGVGCEPRVHRRQIQTRARSSNHTALPSTVGSCLPAPGTGCGQEGEATFLLPWPLASEDRRCVPLIWPDVNVCTLTATVDHSLRGTALKSTSLVAPHFPSSPSNNFVNRIPCVDSVSAFIPAKASVCSVVDIELPVSDLSQWAGLSGVCSQAKRRLKQFSKAAWYKRSTYRSQ